MVGLPKVYITSYETGFTVDEEMSGYGLSGEQYILVHMLNKVGRAFTTMCQFKLLLQQTFKF